jgi:hypothetical protein
MFYLFLRSSCHMRQKQLKLIIPDPCCQRRDDRKPVPVFRRRNHTLCISVLPGQPIAYRFVIVLVLPLLILITSARGAVCLPLMGEIYPGNNIADGQSRESGIWEVKGKITKEEDQPFHQVLVRLTSGGILKGFTHSEVDGSFHIAVAKETLDWPMELEFSSPGYITTMLKANKQTLESGLNVQMSIDSNNVFGRVIPVPQRHKQKKLKQSKTVLQPK